MHSGGPFGGHYHALAREPHNGGGCDQAAGKWHDFNDSRITLLGSTEPELCSAYLAWRVAAPRDDKGDIDFLTIPESLRGTHRALKALSDAVEGSESAYMLLYRRVESGDDAEAKVSDSAIVDGAKRPPTPLREAS